MEELANQVDVIMRHHVGLKIYERYEHVESYCEKNRKNIWSDTDFFKLFNYCNLYLCIFSNV